MQRPNAHHLANADPPSADPDREYDNTLIRRIAGGDRSAFETLYFRHSSRLGGYLWRMLRDRDLVEEALNDTMLVVWKSAARFDFRVRLTTWMFAIAHKKGLKALAQSTRRQYRNMRDDSEVERVPDPDTPERVLARQQRVEQVAKGLETLSPEHRLTLELAFIDGLSYGDIASVTDCPINTVKTRVFHARKRLSAYLADIEGAQAPSDRRENKS